MAESTAAARRPCATLEQVHSGSSRERLLLSRLAPCTCAADLLGEDLGAEIFDERGSVSVISNWNENILGGLKDEVLLSRLLLASKSDGVHTVGADVQKYVTEAFPSSLGTGAAIDSLSSSSITSTYPHTDQPSFRRYLADNAPELLVKAGSSKPDALSLKHEPPMERDAMPAAPGFEQP